jgi:hypothetical protein
MAANKITESLTISIRGAAFSASMTATATADQLGSAYNEESQTITSATVTKLDINPDIPDGKLGYFIFKNTSVPQVGVLPVDATYIDIATDDTMTNKIATVQPGRAAYLPIPGGTVNLWAQAHGANTPSVFLAIEL